MKQTLSVIIPTYNVERFIENAIQSALEQKEVTEIVVVDDGSTDNTLEIIAQRQKESPIIKLYHHPNKVNKGRSATRNLGIQNAIGNYIAFLDADDYFLPNRFTNDFKLFQEIPDCDGVYNAIGAHFYRTPQAKEKERLSLSTVTEKIEADVLFESLYSGKKGHFSIDGLTVKSTVFDRIGYFNEKLLVAEDTDLLWKMALKCHLESGIIDRALAVRGVHGSNVFDDKVLYNKYYIKMLESVLVWSSKNKIKNSILDLLLKEIWIIKQKEKNNLIKDILYWSSIFMPNYQLLLSILSIKYFPLIRYRQMIFPFLYRIKNN